MTRTAAGGRTIARMAHTGREFSRISNRGQIIFERENEAPLEPVRWYIDVDNFEMTTTRPASHQVSAQNSDSIIVMDTFHWGLHLDEVFYGDRINSFDISSHLLDQANGIVIFVGSGEVMEGYFNDHEPWRDKRVVLKVDNRESAGTYSTDIYFEVSDR